jgi:predicted nucleotidyltransferase
MMLPILSDHLPQIQALCVEYGVQCLEAFGSAARGDFDPGKSDFEFLVLFQQSHPKGSVEQYCGLQKELERLLGPGVDLVDICVAKNPHFVAEALAHRVRLYAASETSSFREMAKNHRMWEIIHTKLPLLLNEVEELLKT